MKTNKDNFLEINNLFIKFKANNGNDIYAVNHASLKINKGVITRIIGESGSGKSIIAFSIVNLLPKNGQIVAGSIKFNGKELTHLTNKQLEEIRGNEICFIPQNPMSSLDPFNTIKNQIKEVIVKKIN